MRSPALLLTALLPLAAHAQAGSVGQPPQAGPRRHGPGPGSMAQVLGLSPDQQARVKAIRERHQDALRTDHETARAESQAFRAVMQDPKAGEPQLRQAFDQMNAARFQALLEGRAMRQEMRAVLTPDQLAKADALKARFRERHRARMERRMKAMQRQLDQNP